MHTATRTLTNTRARAVVGVDKHTDAEHERIIGSVRWGRAPLAALSAGLSRRPLAQVIEVLITQNEKDQTTEEEEVRMLPDAMLETGAPLSFDL